MEKYGFVYIWYDIKNKRYYVGCHWGTEDDGYICSSNWMRDAYRRRPNDFKRRIISRIYSNRKDLLDEEHKWLSKIKAEELGNKYYNKTFHKNGHWSVGLTEYEITKQKLKKTSEWKRKISESNKGKIISFETRNKISEKLKGRPLTEEWKKNIKLNHASKKEGYILPKGMLGLHHSQESKLKSSLSQTGPKNHFYGKTHSEEVRKKISEAGKNRIWTEESKKKISETKKRKYPAGETHYMRGFKHTAESIEKIKKTRAKQVFSEESKQKMRESAKKVWAIRKGIS